MYPCKQCLIKPTCSEYCFDAYIISGESIGKSIANKICPDCGSENEFIINFQSLTYKLTCSECNHKFVMLGDFFSTRGLL